MMCSHHMQVSKNFQIPFMDDTEQYLLFTAFSESTAPNKQHDGPKETG